MNEELKNLIREMQTAASEEEAQAVQAKIDAQMDAHLSSIAEREAEERRKLQAKNEEVIAELRAARTRAERFKWADGKDSQWAKEAEAALEQRKKVAEQARIDQGEFEQLKQEWQRDRDKEREQFEKQLAETKQELVRERRDNVVRAKAIQYGVKSSRLGDVLKVLLYPNEERIRLSDADGKTLNVYTSEGSVLPDSIDEFFKSRLREERPDFYEPTGNGGGGAPPGASAKEETAARGTRDGRVTPDQAAAMTLPEYEKARSEGRI